MSDIHDIHNYVSMNSMTFRAIPDSRISVNFKRYLTIYQGIQYQIRRYGTMAEIAKKLKFVVFGRRTKAYNIKNGEMADGVGVVVGVVVCVGVGSVFNVSLALGIQRR